jgi:hypothetical protein
MMDFIRELISFRLKNDNEWVAENTAPLIRYIQYRAKEDFGETLDYEDVHLFLVTKHTVKLTAEQQQFILDCRDEVHRLDCDMALDQLRCAWFLEKGLAENAKVYNDIFHTNGQNERLGTFRADLSGTKEKAG